MNYWIKMCTKSAREKLSIESNTIRNEACVCVRLDVHWTENANSEAKKSAQIILQSTRAPFARKKSNLSKCDFVANSLMRSPEIIIIFRFFVLFIESHDAKCIRCEMYTSGLIKCTERKKMKIECSGRFTASCSTFASLAFHNSMFIFLQNLSGIELQRAGGNIHFIFVSLFNFLIKYYKSEMW